jgi:hypothetical protein
MIYKKKSFYFPIVTISSDRTLCQIPLIRALLPVKVPAPHTSPAIVNTPWRVDNCCLQDITVIVIRREPP